MHSLPGGVDDMPFGEREGGFGWFNNATALGYSYQAVSAAIDFIRNSGFSSSFTLEPLNEAVANRDITAFGSHFALSESGPAQGHQVYERRGRQTQCLHHDLGPIQRRGILLWFFPRDLEHCLRHSQLVIRRTKGQFCHGGEIDLLRHQSISRRRQVSGFRGRMADPDREEVPFLKSAEASEHRPLRVHQVRLRWRLLDGQNSREWYSRWS